MADNVEIQGLEFQIVNDSTQAVAGLQNLINTLNRLKTATNGGATGLSKTAQGIRELSNSLKGLNSGDASQKITRLANALTALSQVGNVKISSSIANQLTAINTALSNLKWTDGDKLTALANGLRPLSELGKANMTTFINQLSKLPKVIEDLEAADIDKFTRQMKDLASAMKPFADEMQKVSNGFSAFPSKIQKLITSTNRYSTSANNATTSTKAWGTALQGIKLSSVVYLSKRIGTAIADYMYDASEWEGIMYRFGRAFGDAAQEDYNWIKRLNSEMKINVQQFMQYSSIFGTMLKGYGVATEDAAKMAMNYTELTYDIWAGYNDIYKSFEDAAIAVRSAIAGEVEPIRKAGFTIVDSQLKITAANYGIAYSSQKASEELKSYLRYLTLVDQAKAQDLIGTYAREMTTAEGLMRTLRQQITSLSQAFGAFLLPILVKVLPYIQAFVELIGEAVVALAALFGVEIQPVDFSGITTGASAAEDMADGLNDASNAAKKLKQYTAGFDELNVFDPNKGNSSSSGAAGGSYAGMFDIDKLWDESIFENINSQVDELKQKLKDVLATVVTIGASILAWKVATSFIHGIQMLKGLMSNLSGVSISFKVLGIAGFLDSMHRFTDWAKDFIDNGPNLDNVVGMLTSFAGGVGYALAILGHTKLGGALILIDGLGEIFLSIRDMTRNGVDIDNMLTLIHGLGNVLTAVGLLTDNPVLTGGGFMLTGITTIVEELRKNWDAIKQGEWGDVDIGVLAIGAIETIGGFLTAIGVLKGKVEKIGGAKGLTETSTTLQETADAIGDSAGGGLNGSLKNIAKNLGQGLVIIVEVSAAAILITGTIWVLGKELGKVGEAWQPVIENAGTVAAAIGIGAGLIGAVGLAAYALGTLGGTAALNIGVGTAILLELGVATALFLAEIWGIGVALDKIQQAWQPVLLNGDTVKTAIETGTALLVGIGVVTAALGAVTLASGATLPAAIAIGAAILSELSLAFYSFAEGLVVVADELNYKVAPALERLNTKLPGLRDDMSDFTEYMSEFADQVSSYTKSMGSVTWSKIVTSFQRIFDSNPIGTLAEDVRGIYTDTVTLNNKLNAANPELKLAVQLMTDYVSLMGQLQQLTQQGNNASTLSLDMFTNLQTVGENLVTGFVTGINNKVATVTSTVDTLKNTITTAFSSMSTTAATDWDNGLTGMSASFTNFQTKALTSLTQFQTSFTAGWRTMWRGVGNAFVGQWNLILTSLERGINAAVDSLNNMIRQINKLSDLTGAVYPTVSKISIEKIAYMANGGFVDEGQLFIAREAGAEMVGAMGRKTAVANNDQIVEGISAGVSIANDGVIAAIYALLDAVEEKDLSVNIGDNEIGQSYDRYNRTRGVRVNTGAFANVY